MGTVVLVRHAQSLWNAEGRFQGQHGPGLTAEGLSQAEVTARWLARTQPDVRALVASDLQRVTESLAPIEETLRCPSALDPRWREVDVGTWTGLTSEQIAARDPDGLEAWRRHEDPAGDGERFADFRTRIAAALAGAWDLAGDGTAVVVTHGGPVRFAVALALELGTVNVLAPVGNSAVTILREHPRLGTQLTLYGSVSHLQ